MIIINFLTVLYLDKERNYHGGSDWKLVLFIWEMKSKGSTQEKIGGNETNPDVDIWNYWCDLCIKHTFCFGDEGGVK